MSTFHEIRFPLSIALGAVGGPERRTEIVTLANGREERNSPWASSRRSWNAGVGVSTLGDLEQLVAFFEARRGRLHGFRWRDALDWKSCALGVQTSPDDQIIGEGDGATTSFELAKTYGDSESQISREIKKPVAGTVRVAVDSVEQSLGADFVVDTITGVVTFTAAPASGASITAGFEFDTPVRFDLDRLDISHEAAAAGEAPHVPVVELLL